MAVANANLSITVIQMPLFTPGGKPMLDPAGKVILNAQDCCCHAACPCPPDYAFYEALPSSLYLQVPLPFYATPLPMPTGDAASVAFATEFPDGIIELGKVNWAEPDFQAEEAWFAGEYGECQEVAVQAGRMNPDTSAGCYGHYLYRRHFASYVGADATASAAAAVNIYLGYRYAKPACQWMYPNEWQLLIANVGILAGEHEWTRQGCFYRRRCSENGSYLGSYHNYGIGQEGANQGPTDMEANEYTGLVCLSHSTVTVYS